MQRLTTRQLAITLIPLALLLCAVALAVYPRDVSVTTPTPSPLPIPTSTVAPTPYITDRIAVAESFADAGADATAHTAADDLVHRR